MEWININDQKPNTKQRVLISFTSSSGNHAFVTVADYIAEKTVLVEDYMSDDYWYHGDYDEEKDCYWTQEGFYEWSYESETNWMLTESVTHWMPLPEPVCGNAHGS